MKYLLTAISLVLLFLLSGHAAAQEDGQTLDATNSLREGRVALDEGHYDVAEGHLRLAMDQARANNDRSIEAIASGNLAFLLSSSGRTGEAEKLFDKAAFSWLERFEPKRLV